MNTITKIFKVAAMSLLCFCGMPAAQAQLRLVTPYGIGVRLPAAAPSNGQVLSFDATSGRPVWVTVSGTYTAPTGTGFPHITLNSQDPAVVGETGSGPVVRNTSPTIGTATLTGPKADTLTVNPTAYANTWNGQTNVVARDDIYDFLHLFDTDDDGKVNVLDQVAGIPVTDINGVLQTPITTPTGLSTAIGATVQTMNAGEINALTSKTSPVSGDVLEIEDSANGFAKRKVPIGNLPSSGGGTTVTVNGGASMTTADLNGNQFGQATSAIYIKPSVQLTNANFRGITIDDAVREFAEATITPSAGTATWVLTNKPYSFLNLNADTTLVIDASGMTNGYRTLFIACDGTHLITWPTAQLPATTNQPFANQLLEVSVLRRQGTNFISWNPQLLSTADFQSSALTGSGKIALILGTLNVASGKTMAFNNSVTINGTDGTTITMPSVSATLFSTAAGEINALTSKATPTTSDLLMIEDAANSFAKRKITIGSLPGGSSSFDISSPANALFLEEFGVGAHGLDGQTGMLGWMNSTLGGGDAIDQGAGEQGHPGIHTITTTAVAAGDGGYLTIGDSSTISSTRIPFKNMAADANWVIYWIFKINNTANTRFRAGVVAAGTGATVVPANWMGCRYDTATGITDSQFQFVTQASSTASTQPLGTVNTGWHKFRMRSTSAGTILGQLDAGTEQTLGTNVPTTDMTPYVEIVTDTTAARNVAMDYFSYYITGLTR